MKFTCFLMMFLVGCFCSSVLADDLSGPISGALTLSESPYTVTDNIYVPSGDTLVIEPGVILFFEPNTKFTIINNATILAIGTVTDSILFTADSLYDWYGINIDTSSTISILKYCIVEYSSDTGIIIRHSNPEIAHCTIRYCNDSEGPSQNLGYGITCAFISNPYIHDNVIASNWGNAGPIAMTYNSHPIIENNLFTGNYSISGAVGIAVGFGCRPLIIGNTITQNRGTWSDVISSIGADSLVIANNVITGNYMSHGARSAVMGIEMLDNALILNNYIAFDTIETSHESGLIYLYESNNCLIKGNVIANNICQRIPVLKSDAAQENVAANNIIYGNVCAAITDTTPGQLFLGYNNIIWNNTPNLLGSRAFFTYSDFNSIMPGTGNIALDPLFRNPLAGDYHLMSTACGDAQNSPCIDAGSAFFSGDSIACDRGLGYARADMGAYGGQLQYPCVYNVGDLNHNDNTDGIDVVYFVNYLKGGAPPVYFCECLGDKTFFPEADVNGSCDVNGLDVTYFVNYLKGAGPGLIVCINCPSIDKQ